MTHTYTYTHRGHTTFLLKLMEMCSKNDFPSNKVVRNYKIYRCALAKLSSGPLRRGENVLITWVTKADRCNHYISAVCIKHSSELTELLRKTSSCFCIKYLEPNTHTQTRSTSVSHTHLSQGISSKGELGLHQLHSLNNLYLRLFISFESKVGLNGFATNVRL